MNKKNICVVTNLATAQLISILLKNRNIDLLILETHYENDTISTFGNDLIIDNILINLDINRIYRLNVSEIASTAMMNIYSIKQWCKLLLMKFRMKYIYKKLKVSFRESIFWGEAGSAFMSYLPKDAMICGLDHSTECLYRYIDKGYVNRLSIFKRNFLYLCTGFMPLYFRTTAKQYSFINSSYDTSVYVDIMLFENDYIKNTLRAMSAKLKKRASALVLLDSYELYEFVMCFHNKQKNKINLKYNQLYDYILNLLQDIELIVLKYHPLDYKLQNGQHLEKHIKGFKEKCQERNKECIHVIDVVDKRIGAFIPAEMYIKYCSFEYLITLGSTSSLNVARKDSKIRCINLLGFLNYDEIFAKFSSVVNPYVTNLDISYINKN